jgi:hypothetical protein
MLDPAYPPSSSGNTRKGIAVRGNARGHYDEGVR